MNVSVIVECAGGVCEPEPPPTPVDIAGCTDPNASNYNPSATVDNGSCRYFVPNVSNFTANYDSVAKRANLSWSLPIFSRLSVVRIVKSRFSVPTSPTSGELVYEGRASSARDSAVEEGNTYYYAAFVRSLSGDYSSGAITSLVIPKAEEEKEPDEEDIIEPGGEGGGIIVSTSSPFENLPFTESKDPLIQKLSLGDFMFLQPGEAVKYFTSGSRIRIKGNKNLTIYLPYEKVPSVLKTIGMTIFDPEDKNKSFSFLLQLNEEKTGYSATIAPFLKDGVYAVSVYILNYEDQTIKQIKGNVTVAGAGNLPMGLAGKIVSQALDPLAVTSGLAVGAGQAILSTGSGVTSLYDLYMLLLRYAGALLGYLGLKRRSKPWGTVYDAVTKRPIDPAYVVVEKDGKEISTAITDIDGRFGFFLPQGTYTLKANKTHYQFPSTVLAGKTADEVYSDLYFGQPVTTTGEEILSLNIPLDPIGFDWNEFAKTKTDFFQVYSKKELARARVMKWIYRIGFLFTLGNFIVYPSWWNLILLSMYVAIQLFQWFWKARHQVISVRRLSGEPIPFAVIRFYMPEVNQMVKTVVADQMGRFYVLLRPGNYYYTIEEKKPDGTYNKIYQSEVMELKKGVISEDIDIISDVPTETLSFAQSL